MRTVEFTFRTQSVDFEVYRRTVIANEYKLPVGFPEGFCVYDLGAGIGCFASACLARGVSHVFCWEPEAEAFRYLSRNVHKQFPRRSSIHRAAIDAGTIDHIIPQEGFDLLKVDLGGGEWDCLCASRNIINAKEILVQYSPVDQEAINQHLKSLRFKVKTRKLPTGKMLLRAVNRREAHEYPVG